MVIVTTTPRQKKIIHDLQQDGSTFVTRGSTFENEENLASSFLENMKKRFLGTRLGQQELMGEILHDHQGALWKHALLDPHKVDEAPPLRRIVIGIDPATTYTSSSDETGIIIAGLGQDLRGYVLQDLSGRHSPNEWARKAVNAYHHYKADRIVAEINAGGDLVKRVIRSIDPDVALTTVRASRGKVTRAEPIAALYEQGRVSHIKGDLETLEHQLCSFIPGKTSKSPDRMDALVWTLTELMLEHGATSSPKAWLA